MTDRGWTRGCSPFHWAAREIQERLGVRERLERLGRRVIRDYMTTEIRKFYEDQPFLVVGAVNRRARPWATLLWGAPGFVRTPDERTVSLAAQPHPVDPLHGAMVPGAAVSLLGIEFGSRRRNTTNGRVESMDGSGLRVRVERSFGNCPRFIRKRSLVAGGSSDREGPVSVRREATIDTDVHLSIDGADGFFIATSFPESAGDPVNGVDVAWRGGPPGFVLVRDERTITWPEFAGNHHYNTLGNLSVDDRAGLLFPAFDSGDLLYLTGRASILWHGRAVDEIPGCRHLVTFRVNEVVLVHGAFPIRWRSEDTSPDRDDAGISNGIATAAPCRVAVASDNDRCRDGARVVFRRSNVCGRWNPSYRSLLDMAEAHGLRPAYGCRSGMCGGCAVTLVQGEVEYTRATLAQPGPGEVLICKAVPRDHTDGTESSDNGRIVLDL